MKARKLPPVDGASDAPEAASLAGSALRGVAWNWTASAILIVAQIASTAATARLVAPNEFGLYAAAQAAGGFAGYFTMAAVGLGLQRRSTLGDKTVGTAIALSLASSLLVAIALWVFASAWADAWGVPDAAWIVRVIALSVLFSSAAIVPIALIRRDLRFREAAIIETGSLVVGLAAGVALAIALHSALALALGQAIGAAGLLVAAAIIVRAELRLDFHRSDARELLTFATQVGALGFLSYVNITAPSWFAGRVFGASVLGLYSRASLIVSLPATYAVTSIYKVIFPLYGRVREDLTRTKTLVAEGLTLTTGLLWPVFALLAGAAALVVNVLLGSRWDEAAPFVALVALAACAYIPAGVLTNAAEAFGWMRIVAARQITLSVGVAATLTVVYVTDVDFAWSLAGIAVFKWMAYLLTLGPFVRRGLLDIGRVARDQGIHAGVALASFGLATVGAHAAGGAPVVVQVLVLAAATLIVGGVLAALSSHYPATVILRTRLAQLAPVGRGSRFSRFGSL